MLFDMVQAMCRATDLDGVAMFEFKVDDDTGTASLIEVNARFWGSLPLAIAAGIDFPYLLFRQLVYGIEEPRKDYRVAHYARHVASDVYQLAEHLSVRRSQGRWAVLREAGGWLFSFRRIALLRESHDAFSWHDPRPALREYAMLTRRLGRRLLGRPWVHRQWTAARLSKSVAAAAAAARIEARPLRILVICHGNICRSPYAAAALRSALADAGVSAQVDSAGLAFLPGRPSPDEALKVAFDRGHDMSQHRSSYATDDELVSADIILLFDQANEEMLAARGVTLKRPPIFLGALANLSGNSTEIADPVGGSETVFERTYAVIDTACIRLVEAIGQR